MSFGYRLQDGDRISVFPPFRALDVTPLPCVAPPPLAEARFVLDTHLGKLAAYLRLLGLDTAYRNDYDDRAIVRLACRERRIVLTRDRGLLKHGAVTHGYCVRSATPQAQLVEVVRRFDLAAAATPFRRCLRCNGLVVPVAKERVQERLLPRTRAHYDEFSACTACAQVYWKGSHYRRMQRLLAEALDPEAPAARC